jgi:hypothetical protein
MAAVPEAQFPELVDLWQVHTGEMEAMLAEEVRTWREQLDWDYSASADLVRRFVQVHALNGAALLVGSEAVGYTYFVCEEHKGLIGDLFLRSEFRTPENEHRLLEAVIDPLMHTRGIRRIESQLILARFGQRRQLPAFGYSQSHQRNFMVFDLAAAPDLPSHRTDRILYDRWSERRQD